MDRIILLWLLYGGSDILFVILGMLLIILITLALGFKLGMAYFRMLTGRRIVDTILGFLSESHGKTN